MKAYLHYLISNINNISSSNVGRRTPRLPGIIATSTLLGIGMIIGLLSQGIHNITSYTRFAKAISVADACEAHLATAADPIVAFEVSDTAL